MRSFALLGLVSFLSSCAARVERCGLENIDYTAKGAWHGNVTVAATDYAGANGGKFVIDGHAIPLGPDLTTQYQCLPGKHTIFLEVNVEDQVICERGYFTCR